MAGSRRLYLTDQLRRAVPAILALLCACAPLPSPSRLTPPPDPKTLMPALEDRVFQLVNDDRARHDPATPPLTPDAELASIARKKSADMAAHHYLSHAAPDGQTTATLLLNANPRFVGLLGENIAAQPFLPEYGIQVEAYARRIVDVWLASPRHRDNLSDPAYRRTGIGAVIGGNTVYVTELFADAHLPASKR